MQLKPIKPWTEPNQEIQFDLVGRINDEKRHSICILNANDRCSMYATAEKTDAK